MACGFGSYCQGSSWSCAPLGCGAGSADCDGSAANGCETGTNADNANCGGCGVTCTGENFCQAGVCAPLTCEPGLANCDNDRSNGCEVVTTSDANNCGGCGIICKQGDVCQDSQCLPPHYSVNQGPAWNPAPPAYNCVQACAVVLGGTAASWRCSTDPATVNGLAWYSTFGSSQHCKTFYNGSGSVEGTPLADNYALSGTYWEASMSAYVSDHCQSDSVNYCFPAAD
jgi:hypothetical protein